MLENAKTVHSTTLQNGVQENEPIIIRNPSPELIEFIERKKKRQKEIHEQIRKKYGK